MPIRRVTITEKQVELIISESLEREKSLYYLEYSHQAEDGIYGKLLLELQLKALHAAQKLIQTEIDRISNPQKPNLGTFSPDVQNLIMGIVS